MVQWLVYFILLLPLAQCTPQTLGIPQDLRNAEPWQQLMYNVTKMAPFSTAHATWIGQIRTAIIPGLEHVLNVSQIHNREVSEQCAIDTTLYNNGINKGELWAMTMFDASSKIPESILSGAYAFLGNMEQCLTMTKDKFGTQFSSKATGVAIYIKSIKPNSKFAIFFVLNACMPETCSGSDIQEIFQDALRLPLLSVGAISLVQVPDIFSFTGEDYPPLDASAIVVIVLFSLLALIVALATIYQIITTRNRNYLIKGKMSDVVLSFSAYRNIKTLMSLNDSPHSVTSLHGLRVLSLFWVMLGHSYANTGSSLLLNSIDTANIYENDLAAILYNSYVAVDTFFFLSGFLMCYVFINDMMKKRPFNIFKFYLYRYLRLTAPLALVVAFFAAILPLIGYGPAWRFVIQNPSETCKKRWWLTMIYLNNYIRPDPNDFSLCLHQSWYLSVDMQLAWLSPLVLIPLWKWPKKTYQILLPLLILASCFAPFTSTYINNFPMQLNVQIDPDVQLRYALEIYQTFHMRATPYLVGIATAYFMIKVKKVDLSLKWWAVLICWCLSTAVALAVVFIPSVMYNDDYVYEPVGAAFYGGFHRLGWSLSLSWIVFACTRGFGGVVNSILSWPGWLPLSRLSYCAFLTHLSLISYKAGNLRYNAYFSHFDAVHTFFGELVFTMLVIAPTLHIICEAPTLNLLRVFFSRDPPKIIPTKDHD